MGLDLVQLTSTNAKINKVKQDENNENVFKMTATIGEHFDVLIRFYTKNQTIEAGKNYLVIGRPYRVSTTTPFIIEASTMIPVPEATEQRNEIILAGTLSEPKWSNNPKAPVKFGVATERYNIEAKEKQTTWINVTLWGVPAGSNRSKLITKGQNMSFSGQLSAREYEGKTYYDVSTRSFGLLPSKKSLAQENNNSGSYQNSPETTVSAEQKDWDDVAF